MIPITQDALNKANLIARRIKELSGVGLECYMWFTSHDDVIRDVHIVDAQDVTNHSCAINGYGKDFSQWRLNKIGERVIGWCHSHGDFHNFFSQDDKRNYISEVDRGGESAYLMTVNAENHTPYCAIGKKTAQGYQLNEHVGLSILHHNDQISMDVDEDLLDKVRLGGRTLRQRLYGKKHSAAYLDDIVAFESEWKSNTKPDKDYLHLLQPHYQKHTAHIVEKNQSYSTATQQLHTTYEEHSQHRLQEAVTILQGKKGWRWSARLENLKQLYTNPATESEKKELEKLQSVVSKNRYAMRMYGSAIEKLFRELQNNEQSAP